MIRYALRCDKGHDFEGWFRNSEGFDASRAAGQVACAICGSTNVEKALMAPAARASDKAETKPLRTPRNEVETALEKLRDHVEANSDYVGLQFAAEARAMHAGSAPERPIHGEAKPEEARKLIEEGVPIAPLPFLPRNKAN